MRLHSTLRSGLHPRLQFLSSPRAAVASLATATLLLLACSPEARETAPAEPSTPVDPLPISGIYDVRGSTTPLTGGGDKREIAGTVVLRQDGDRYSATFKLDTTFPGVDEPLAADVIGRGDGSIDGRTLSGSAHTQLIVATVPGIDPDFAFIPRIVGARIVSSSVTQIAADGSVVIELQNRPEEGEDYQPTLTRLTGLRVADADARRPDVAAGNGK